MAVINYTAKRNVDASRTVGNSYNLTLNFTRFDRAPKRHNRSVKSLSGAQFDTFHRLDIFRNCATIPYDDAATLTQIREFLDSCAGGETFQIDSVDHKLEGDYSESLVDLSGFYSFAFKAREQ